MDIVRPLDGGVHRGTPLFPVGTSPGLAQPKLPAIQTVLTMRTSTPAWIAAQTLTNDSLRHRMSWPGRTRCGSG